MKSVLLAALCACLAAVPAAAGPEKKPAPLVACIEPSLLRTDTSQLIPGSKKTVITPARPDDLGLSRLTKEEFAAAGLKWDGFLKEAAAVSAAHLKTLKPDIRRDRKGTALYAVLKSDSHLTAGIILCPELFTRFQPVFGDRLVVLAPNRFTVYVFPRNFSDFQKMGPSIIGEYNDSTWPCSQEAFEITADGIRGLGAFDSADEDEPVPSGK
jgi:hypothetical protein